VTPGGVGQFVVGAGGAQLALNTFNPTGFSLFGTHGKTLMSFQPTSNTAIVLTARLRLTSLQPGLVYGLYLYACQTPATCATNHDEADIELVTNTLQPGGPLTVQLNQYANEPLGAGNGGFVNLPTGFDPLASHDWSIRWSLSQIDYLVDGVLLSSATTHVPQGPMQANVIAWGPAADWMAAFSPLLQPVSSQAQNQSFVAILRSLTITLTSASSGELPGGPGTPSLRFTNVPPKGSFQNLTGQALHVKPSDYYVAVFIHVNGGWWTKPYLDSPKTQLSSTGDWTCDITTGGVDEQADQIAAFLLPATFNVPLASGNSSIPGSLGTSAVAVANVTR
jgi:hypothetical protein